jgi:hypothetical protein
LALIAVRAGATDIHACPRTSDVCAGIYTATSNTNACPNASNIEACPNADEDYPSACAVIESVCIAGDTEGKYQGKGYSKKGHTCNPVHFNLLFANHYWHLVIFLRHHNNLTCRQPKVIQGFGQR